MSVISEMIKKLEKEYEDRKEENERETAASEKIYEDLKKRVEFYKEQSERQMESITRGLDKLVANKHTIEKALEQTTENLHGLPIPYDQHGAVVNLVTKMAESVNNITDFSSSSTLSIDQVHQDAISISEKIESDLKECHTEVSEAQSLYQNAHALDNLIRDANESTQMNGSIFELIN